MPLLAVCYADDTIRSENSESIFNMLQTEASHEMCWSPFRKVTGSLEIARWLTSANIHLPAQFVAEPFDSGFYTLTHCIGVHRPDFVVVHE